MPDIPENEFTIFNADIDDESQTKYEDPHEPNKNSEDFDDTDPMDEEFLVPTKPGRSKRTIAFRPKFVYDQQQERASVEAQDRIQRRSGRAQGEHHRHNQGHGHGHEHRSNHHNANY